MGGIYAAGVWQKEDYLSSRENMLHDDVKIFRAIKAGIHLNSCSLIGVRDRLRRKDGRGRQNSPQVHLVLIFISTVTY